MPRDVQQHTPQLFVFVTLDAQRQLSASAPISWSSAIHQLNQFGTPPDRAAYIVDVDGLVMKWYSPNLDAVRACAREALDDAWHPERIAQR